MIWWTALFFLQAPQVLELPAVTSNPYTTQADIGQGKKLYAGRCAGCHGPSGDGGKGANLAVPQLPRAGRDIDLFRVLRYGLPETEMPGSLMPDREIWQMAAFVRTLGRLQTETSTGDPKHGAELVNGKAGCLNCHYNGTIGGRLGPPLTDIGARRSPGYLRNRLTDPAADIPDTFRVVELRTQKGDRITGIRLSEDTWSIQVRDMSDRLHSLWKQDLAELKVEKRTLMPSYKDRLDAREMNDVIAYLAGLRGDQ